MTFLTMASLTRLSDLLREKHMKLSQVETCFLNWLVRELNRREPEWKTFADMYRAYPPDWVFDQEIDGRSDILRLFFDSEAQEHVSSAESSAVETSASILEGLVGKTEGLASFVAGADDEEAQFERSRQEEMLMRSRPESDAVVPRELLFDGLDFWETLIQCVQVVQTRMIGYRRVPKDRDEE